MVLRIIEARIRTDRGALAVRQSDLLKNYFTGRNPVDEAEADDAEIVFQSLRARDQWLACDCQPEDSPAPLLCTASPMTLRRMPAPNPSHAAACCFVRRKRNEASEIMPRWEAPGDDLLVHGGYGADREAQAAGQGGGGDRSRLPFISQVMFRILHDSGRNAVFHNENPVGRLDALATYKRMGNVRLCGHDDTEVKVRDMLVTASDERTSIPRIMQLKERIAEYDPSTWPGRGRPQGYMMGIATGFRYDEAAGHYELNMYGWDRSIFIDARPRIFAEATPTDARSPYICIVSYAKATRDGGVRGLRCYLQPCFAPDSWFPVDSDKERDTMEVLLDVRSEFAGRLQIDIRKPLFDEKLDVENEIDNRFRPDFILWAKHPGRRPTPIAVETMGSNDQVYRDRKIRTHSLMLRRYRHLIKHDLSGSSSEVRSRATADFVEELSKLLSNLR
jgi:hypothetical protein